LSNLHNRFKFIAPRTSFMRATLFLSIDPLLPSDETIATAARLLRDGKLVVFPTETVYGLGANAISEAAVRGIFEAKGRPSNNPLIVHVPDVCGAMQLTTDWPETADRLAQAFWPGPLTLVLPRRSHVPDIVTAGGPTVAVRCPAHPVARALLRASGLPVAAPSANRSGLLSPTRAEHALHDLEGRVDLILDAGPTSEGIESTVVDLSRERPLLLRPGTVTPEAIERVIGRLDRNHSASDPTVLRSPGLLSRHYSPRTPLVLFRDAADLATLPHDARLGIVTLGSNEFRVRNWVVRVELPDDPKSYATRLYDELHRLDEHMLQMILVQMPPESPGWLAIRDRLARASSHKVAEEIAESPEAAPKNA
jgi:L-threonylcarbamoyladenylate synthase